MRKGGDPDSWQEQGATGAIELIPMEGNKVGEVLVKSFPLPRGLSRGKTRIEILE